jgi:hypothetical protein
MLAWMFSIKHTGLDHTWAAVKVIKELMLRYSGMDPEYWVVCHVILTPLPLKFWNLENNSDGKFLYELVFAISFP